MQVYQDLNTGAIVHVKDNEQLLQLSAMGFNLSLNILQSPSEFHKLVSGQWVFDAQSKKQALLYLIEREESKQARAVRELLIDAQNAGARAKIESIEAVISGARAELIALGV